MSRKECQDRLGVPLPPGEVVQTVNAKYTFTAILHCEDRCEDLVTWCKQNLEILVPERFRPVPSNIPDRYTRRDLAHSVLRMAHFQAQDGTHRLSVTIEDDRRKPYRKVEVSRVLTGN